MEKRTGLFENGLIWFGAGVSLAEILTGMYFAPLGFSKGIIAILLGHLIGAVPLFLAGIISGKSRKTSMESVKMSFGHDGGKFFALMNVIQLVGWTAIMIYDGALSADTAIPGGKGLWCLVIGALIVLWILIGITNLGKINTIAMALLFILTILLCKVIFFSNLMPFPVSDAITFGAAVELAVSMPLSWLPCIGDYTMQAQKPVAASAVSTFTYSVVSTWMFIIGMGAAIFTRSSDIATIMTKAGFGIAGLLIIVFSTVTTTFLDALSAGISAKSLINKYSARSMGATAAIVGTILAILFNMDDITNFLYFIGSIFAPMTAIMITDYFFLHRNTENKAFSPTALFIWLIGFILYRIFMTIDIPVGNTLPDMLITSALMYIVSKIQMKKA